MADRVPARWLCRSGFQMTVEESDGAFPGEFGVVGAIVGAGVGQEAVVGAFVPQDLDGRSLGLERLFQLFDLGDGHVSVGGALMDLDG